MANLKIGLVGLPNVGKSTLFNLLTNLKVPAQNYPFCTIDPNIGIVKVEDERLDKISEIVNPKEIIPAVVEFVDIAGLVKDAHKGEGLGNKFLANIREVSVILEIVRAFENPDIEHVSKVVDPFADIETIKIELILKDLETVKAAIAKQERFARTDKKIKEIYEMLLELKKHLEEENHAFSFKVEKDLQKEKDKLFLLTDKQFIYLLNSDKKFKDLDPKLQEFLKDKTFFIANLKDLEEIASLDEEEKQEFISQLEIGDFKLSDLISRCYETLGLISFFTAGEKEARAWTITKGMSIAQAAGVIHTDFEKNFISAEVVSYKDFVKNNGWLGSKEAGKFRIEGKGYIVEDGDVVVIRHNA